MSVEQLPDPDIPRWRFTCDLCKSATVERLYVELPQGWAWNITTRRKPESQRMHIWCDICAADELDRT